MAQAAIARSHVANLIAPAEAAGYRVDVYLATYGCGCVLPEPAHAALPTRRAPSLAAHC